jgi:hypothetical protein
MNHGLEVIAVVITMRSGTHGAVRAPGGGFVQWHEL